MEQTVVDIDGNSFEDFDGFICELNRGFVALVGGQWNGNLDAFNDYLSWADDRCTIRWRNAGKSRVDLRHAAMAKWPSGSLARCLPRTDRPFSNDWTMPEMGFDWK